MLKYFNAALSNITRVQPLDHLARLAETFLDVSAVVLVSTESPRTVLGSSEGANALDGETLDAALTTPGLELPLHGSDRVTIAGTTLPGRGPAAPLEANVVPLPVTDAPPPQPFGRVIHIALKSDKGTISCLLFPIGTGLALGDLRRFRSAAHRHLCEHALLQRYRTDLRRYVMLFDHMQRTAKIGVWEYDMTTQTLFWSDEVYRIYELPVGPQPPQGDLRHFPDPGRRQLREALRRTQRTGEPCDLTLPFKTEQGRRRMVRMLASLQPGGEGRRLAGVIQDVTALNEATERLWWTANHDALTSLPNRALFADRFRKALERRTRTGKLLALVLVDVDKFKEVNDSLGHAAGDELLKLVSATLTDTVRANDTVARTGGDEFSILLEDIDDMDGMHAILERLHSASDVRLEWEESTMMISLSAGTAVAPTHGTTERELIGAADLALYRMKERQGAALSLYCESFGRAVHDRNRLLADARAALERSNIIAHYQPQVELDTGRIVGVEALARWVKADGTTLCASEFAYALGDHEVGVLIGQSVVARAISEIAALNRGRADKVALSVNSSAGELTRDAFLQRIGRQHCGLSDAGPITVEITEDIVIGDADGALARQMDLARGLGVEFALSDFGTGYASLIHMAELPLSAVKMNRKFIASLESDETKRTILRGVIHMARSLGLKLVVEGVETAEQARLIGEFGAHWAQGYHYCPPLPLADLAVALERGVLPGRSRATPARAAAAA